MKTTKKSEPVHLHEHYKEEEQHLDKDVLSKHSGISECFFYEFKISNFIFFVKLSYTN
jgi:hypothetical protein